MENENNKKISHLMWKKYDRKQVLSIFCVQLVLSKKMLEAFLAAKEINYHEVWFCLGQIAAATNYLEFAAIFFKKAIDCNACAKYYFELGNTLWILKKNNQAEVCYRKVLTYDPDHINAHVNLALVHNDINPANHNSIILLQKAIDIDPSNADLHVNLGYLYQEHGNYEQALNCFLKALNLGKDETQILICIADNYMSTNDLDNAWNYYKQALEKDNKSTPALGGLCVVLNKLGHEKKARKLLQYAVNAGVIDGAVLLAGAKLCKSSDEKQFFADNILKILPSIDLPQNRRKLLFNAAALYDSLEQYEIAFCCLIEANKLKNKKFCKNKFLRKINEIKKSFRKIYNIKNNNKEKCKTIFIVGMPRSGTTMLEQILIRHDSILSIGEKKEPANLIKKYTNNAEKIRYEYLQLFQHKTKYVINKMPHNFLFAGHIKKIFPEAYIIHCKRNKSDTCLSIFFQDFLERHDYAYDMNNIDWYYDQYLSIMHYWKINGIDFIEINYEDVVNNPKDTITVILNNLDLKFNEDMLFFYKNNNYVNTASFQQVRKPIYKTSINKHKKYIDFGFWI